MNLIETVKKNIDIELFTTPSHDRSFALFSKLKQFYKCDISETDAFNPQEALFESEKKATSIYKTKSTNYLINGSTCGIIAAILTCVKQGENVLIWEEAHICHKNAVVLAGANPVYYSLEMDNNWGIYKEANLENLEKILKRENIKALIITSPSYEGIVSDIASIKNICKKYGAYLIVDEAHGALYPFCEELPTSSIYLGADIVVQSLHKTAGGLNPTALLHNNTDLDVKYSLDKITTTSPSYPLLASVERNINYLNSKKGRNKISELVKNIEELKSSTYDNLEFYSKNDPTKILIKHSQKSGEELSEFLYKNKIEDERTNKKSTMLLCGLGTDLKKLNRLKKVLKKL